MSGYSDVLEGLRAELTKVEAEIAKKEETRDRLLTAISTVEDLAKAAAPANSNFDYSKETVRDGAIHILLAEKKPLDVREIAARLTAAGKTASDMYNSVYSALTRESQEMKPRVVKEGKRRWKAV